MSQNVNLNDVFKHPFILEVVGCFPHIDSLREAHRANDASYFLGCDVSTLVNGEYSISEYLIRNLLKKCSNISVPDVDPIANAKDSFLALLCEQDERLPYYATILEQITPSTSFGRIMLRAQKLLHDLTSDFSVYAIKPRYTSGATIELNRRQGSNPFARYNQSNGYDVVDNALNVFCSVHHGIVEDVPRSQDFMPVNMRAKHPNRNLVVADVVPKVWKIGRLIGLSDEVPLAFQTGTGDWLAAKAATVGLRIDVAQDKHKDLARLASVVDGHLMTADQSDASNRILRILVQFLFPNTFYAWLANITPSTIQLDGVDHRIHMMAPMGNGYIFPLQTLIFWALAKATCQEKKVKPEVYCYGDDLIAPSQISSTLFKVFEYIGLKINVDKTFVDGPFRESCGGDYLLGSNVRPLYIKELPYDETTWYRCINGIRRVCYTNNDNTWRQNDFRRLWHGCIRKSIRQTGFLAHARGTASCVSWRSRLFAPTHYGDVAISTDDERLYRLTYKTRYAASNGRTYKYPGKGIHESGYPYSGYYITILGLKSADPGISLGRASKGIRNEDVLRVLPLASVKGAGLKELTTFTTLDGVRVREVSLRYPAFFESLDGNYHPIETVFFTRPPAPNENMTELWSILDHSCPVFDFSAVVDRAEARHTHAISRLHAALLHLYEQRNALRVEVIGLDFNI